MLRRKPVVLVLSTAVVLAAAGAWFLARRTAHPQVQAASCRGCNLLLITIDTLRRDRVGAFGGPAGLTPTLDRLATEGIRLDNAYASAPLTLPSHTSIMTAVPPPVHGVRTNGLFRLGPALPTLASVLKAAGYRTGAFVGAFVLDARFGLNRGFDVYDDRYGEKPANAITEGAERRAEDVVKPAGEWILRADTRSAPTEVDTGSAPTQADTRADTRSAPTRVDTRSAPTEVDTGSAPTRAPDTNHLSVTNPESRIPNPHEKPWFAWVHLYDPHEPYDPPAEYAKGREPYDGEVAYTDATIGQFLDQLRAAGQLDRTLIIVAADHGESLGEHNERTHGVFVYEVTMRVPWIIWGGSRVPSGTFDGLSRLIDLAPTALDLLGVASPASFVGTSLVRAIRGDDAPPSTAYLEAMDANLTRNWAPLTAIVSGRHKLIELPIPELYDLAADPGETSNLFSRDAGTARTLSSLLRDLSLRLDKLAATGVDKPMLTAESRQRLQALGYVATSADPGQRVYTDADDPKNLIGVSNDLNRALGEFKAGSRESAMSAVAQIIREHPAFTTAYGILASMQRDTGDLPGAIRTLETIVQKGSVDPSVMTVLAGYLQEAGALDRAADVLQAVLASHADYAEAWNSLGVVFSRMGRHADARAAFGKVLALDPTSATAYENLGVDEFHAGDLTNAATDLDHALSLDARLSVAHNALGTVYMRLHQPERAFAEWKAALALNPRLYDALYNLGTSLWDAGRRDEARPYLERFVNEAPPPYAADVARLRPLVR